MIGNISVQLGQTTVGNFMAFVHLLTAVLPKPLLNRHVLVESVGYMDGSKASGVATQFAQALGDQIEVSYGKGDCRVIGSDSGVTVSLSCTGGLWIVTLAGSEEAITAIAEEAKLGDVWEVTNPTSHNVSIGAAIEHAKLAVACAD